MALRLFNYSEPFFGTFRGFIANSLRAQQLSNRDCPPRKVADNRELAHEPRVVTRCGRQRLSGSRQNESEAFCEQRRCDS